MKTQSSDSEDSDSELEGSKSDISLSFENVNPEELAKMEERAGLKNNADLAWDARIELLKKSGVAKLLTKPLSKRKASVGGKWSVEEDTQLKEIVKIHGPKNWRKIAEILGSTRTDVQCLHRWNKVLRPGLHKGSWSEEEDEIVRTMVLASGIKKVKWSNIAECLPGRIGKQCRERWFNHLDPNIKTGDWILEEDKILYQAQTHFGNRWCEISKMLPGRTENAVKNRWNSSTMRRWLKDMNYEPGSGIPIQDISMKGMHKALTSFCDALLKDNVDMTFDKACSLLGLNDIITADGSLPEIAMEEYSNVKDKKSKKRTRSDDDSDLVKIKVKGKVPKAAVNKKIKGGAIAPGKKKKKLEHLLFDDVELLDEIPFNQGLRLLPNHLRPPLIITNGDYDDDTEKLIDVLKDLKSTPSPLGDPDANKRRNSRRQKNASTKSAGSDNHNGTFAMPVGQVGGNIAGSPIGRAVQRVNTLLSSGTLTGNTPKDASTLRNGEDNIPIQMLPYFRHLNENAQRGLMRQLIEVFQRTSCTPRGQLIATPKNPNGDAGFSNWNFPESYMYDYEADPNCFDNLDSFLNSNNALLRFSPRGLSPRTSDMLLVDNESLPSPHFADSKTGRSTRSKEKKFSEWPILENNGQSNSNSSSSSINNSANISKPNASVKSTRSGGLTSRSQPSNSDDAVEAAVMLALQAVSSKPGTAEEMLKYLMNTDENI